MFFFSSFKWCLLFHKVKKGWKNKRETILISKKDCSIKSILHFRVSSYCAVPLKSNRISLPEESNRSVDHPNDLCPNEARPEEVVIPRLGQVTLLLAPTLVLPS